MITFPGHGLPGEHCGEDVHHGCWDCKDYFVIKSKCMKKSCPDCYQDWAARQGAHAADRMTEFMRSPQYLDPIQNQEFERYVDALSDVNASVEEARFYRIQTYHIVVTFKDASLVHGKDIKRYRRIARNIVRRHGIYGECSIPHRRDESDAGAHFHFLGLAGYITPAGGDDADHIFKVIKHEDSWYPRDFLDRMHVVRYACTHAVITSDDDPSHCVTWSGCVANNKFPGRAEYDHIPQEQPQCPHCGGHDTFVVLERDWVFRETVEVWTAPDRPPPYVKQRCITEF